MLSQLYWKDELKTGNDIIDLQHKELIARIRNLIEGQQLYNERGLGEAIAYLTDYVFEHFTLEESVMLKTNYDGFEEHRDEHSHYMKYLFRLRRNLILTNEMIEGFEAEISGWFLGHVLKTDVKMAEHLRSYCNQILP